MNVAFIPLFLNTFAVLRWARVESSQRDENADTAFPGRRSGFTTASFADFPSGYRTSSRLSDPKTQVDTAQASAKNFKILTALQNISETTIYTTAKSQRNIIAQSSGNIHSLRSAGILKFAKNMNAAKTAPRVSQSISVGERHYKKNSRKSRKPPPAYKALAHKKLRCPIGIHSNYKMRDPVVVVSLKPEQIAHKPERNELEGIPRAHRMHHKPQRNYKIRHIGKSKLSIRKN